MDPRHRADAELFRKRVRHVPRRAPARRAGRASARSPTATRPTRSSTRGARRWPPTGCSGVSWPKEYGGAGLIEARAGRARRGAGPGRRPGDGLQRHLRHQDARRHAAAVGDRGAEALLPARGSSAARTGGARASPSPGSGSDLASLSTRAVLDGDRWVIDGQKVWTSRAREANWIFLLARTDPTAPQARGASRSCWSTCDQPGVEVRPITRPVGRERVQRGLLHRRHHAGRPRRRRGRRRLGGGDRPCSGSSGARRRPPTRSCSGPSSTASLALARERGATDDPVVRQRLADAHIRCEIMRFLGLRILTGVLDGDGHARPGGLDLEALLERVPPAWSPAWRSTCSARRRWSSTGAARCGRTAPTTRARRTPPARGSATFYNATAGTIYAGTSEVQRNILGESVLGLPREPR